MGGKGRVITTAMLRMKHQGYIQHLSLQFRVGSVFPKKPQNILRCGQLRLGIADNETLVQVIMAVSVIAIDAEQGELGNQP